MTNQEDWYKFLDNLLSNAVADHQSSKEYEHQKQRQAQLDEILTLNLTWDEKTFVQEIIAELEVFAQRETQVVYQKGLKDCVWLLKNMGVLA